MNSHHDSEEQIAIEADNERLLRNGTEVLDDSEVPNLGVDAERMSGSKILKTSMSDGKCEQSEF